MKRCLLTITLIVIIIVMYGCTLEAPIEISEDQYYFPEPFEYDGPYLDDHFFEMPLYSLDEDEGVYVGTGGAFQVEFDPSELKGRCIDGDTSVFWYPEDIYERIEARVKSTRYLNIDTPETWPQGEEEEWGKTASVYVCDLLHEAESVVLQTDPGDNLLGIYGRLLAWVWIQLPGEEEYFLLNYMIVRQGLGEVRYLFGAGETDVTVWGDKTYTEWMFYAEWKSKQEALGMHGEWYEWYWDYERDRANYERWSRKKGANYNV